MLTHVLRSLWIAGIWAFSACSDAVGPPQGVDVSELTMAGAPAPNPSTTRYETRFMQGMIDHHAMAVMMGEMCVDRAVHDELRSMCEGIVATQSQEIATMQGWLSDWYGSSYEPQMKPADAKKMESLAALDGLEFEISFMETMIKHHENAIQEASRCVERAYHSELIELCEDIIEVQQTEIAQLRGWLCEWYDIGC
jgi:uncharacterized protein (DUF305 family)